MDISQLVNSEDLFELKLLGPDKETPVGITFWVRSYESDAVKRVSRQHGDKFLGGGRKSHDLEDRGRISRQGGDRDRQMGLGRT